MRTKRFQKSRHIFCFLLACSFFSLLVGIPQAFAQVKEIKPQELKALIKKNPGIQIIDVRETWEVERAKIPKSEHIPLQDIATAKDHLNMEKPVVTYCHHGRRGQTAAEILNKMGFREVYNLEGGIDAYSLEVDPSIPRY